MTYRVYRLFFPSNPNTMGCGFISFVGEYSDEATASMAAISATEGDYYGFYK
jgi:hypothetical protein